MGNKQNKKNDTKDDSNEEKRYFNRDIYIPPLTEYKYFERIMPYTYEEKEISEDEQKKYLHYRLKK